ncbi:MAG: isoquinoline 1-oxidoreductase [Herminiimonas sp.]|jgi:isoquinoline 1-oxidoreductase alpha subunit|nr:isoquinoline 1-oxidoreductase [Herminiimonas sp.]
MSTFQLNGKTVTVEAPPDTPLLWALRDNFGMTGTKFGCGAALCGACTVHMDGVATLSCVMPIGAIIGRSITTIEGLSGRVGQQVQRSWDKFQVPQCGYCQSGQVMAAASLLSRIPEPTDADIDDAMQGNLCRCGTYPRIRIAIHDAARKLKVAK